MLAVCAAAPRGKQFRSCAPVGSEDDERGLGGVRANNQLIPVDPSLHAQIGRCSTPLSSPPPAPCCPGRAGASGAGRWRLCLRAAARPQLVLRSTSTDTTPPRVTPAPSAPFVALLGGGAGGVLQQRDWTKAARQRATKQQQQRQRGQRPAWAVEMAAVVLQQSTHHTRRAGGVPPPCVVAW